MILRDIPTEPSPRACRYCWQAKRGEVYHSRLDELFWSQAERELHQRRSPYLYWQRYAIEFRPRQYFRVAELDRNTLRIIEGSSRTVNEVGGFFQKSFVEVLRDRNVGIARQVAMIAATKDRRQNFVKITDRERRYCALECDLLAQVMEGLRADCEASECAPPQWRGAGAIAARLHQLNKTPRQKERVRAARLDKLCIEAYYGGRFEITRVGRIAGPVYENDINSAYPAQMLKLPCPVHTRWHPFTEALPAKAALSTYVAALRFWHPPEAILCGFPLREKGHLYWPREGAGVYWSPEIAAAVLAGAEVEYEHGYYAEERCNCEPSFGWVERLYEQRKAMGKSTRGYPLKLGINALYGKLAQRLGAAPYRDHLAAGLITAHTRATLIRAYRDDPASILYIATDAIFSTAPLAVNTGDGLGQWDTKLRPEGLFIVQPGIYWSPGSDSLPKTRGIPRSQVIAARAQFEELWSRYLDRDQVDQVPSCGVPIWSFIGHRLALQRGKPLLAGRWIDQIKNVDFDWQAKRQPVGSFVDGSLWTRPFSGIGPDELPIRSQPYDPAMLSELDERLLTEEADPDFIPWGNTVE